MSRNIGNSESISLRVATLAGALANLLQSMADAEPCGQSMAALHPTEDPGYGTEIVETATSAAARWTRTSTGEFEFIDGRGSLEILQELGIVGDVFAIESKSIRRHLVHGVVPARVLGGTATQESA